MKKLKEKLIHWLGGYTSLIEAQPPRTIITSIAPLIRLKVVYKMFFPEDMAYIKRELAKKLVDNIIENHMVMIDTNDNEVMATLYIADIREVR